MKKVSIIIRKVHIQLFIVLLVVGVLAYFIFGDTSLAKNKGHTGGELEDLMRYQYFAITSLPGGNRAVLNHSLSSEDLLVLMYCNQVVDSPDGNFSLSNALYGGDTISSTVGWWGFTDVLGGAWYNLTNETISVGTGGADFLCGEIRLYLWAFGPIPETTIYAPEFPII